MSRIEFIVNGPHPLPSAEWRKARHWEVIVDGRLATIQQYHTDGGYIACYIDQGLGYPSGECSSIEDAFSFLAIERYT